MVMGFTECVGMVLRCALKQLIESRPGTRLAFGITFVSLDLHRVFSVCNWHYCTAFNYAIFKPILEVNLTYTVLESLQV